MATPVIPTIEGSAKLIWSIDAVEDDVRTTRKNHASATSDTYTTPELALTAMPRGPAGNDTDRTATVDASIVASVIARSEPPLSPTYSTPRATSSASANGAAKAAFAPQVPSKDAAAPDPHQAAETASVVRLTSAMRRAPRSAM